MARAKRSTVTLLVRGTITADEIVTALTRECTGERKRRLAGRVVVSQPRVDWRRFHKLLAEFIIALDKEAMNDVVTRALWRHCEKIRRSNRRQIRKDWDL